MSKLLAIAIVCWGIFFYQTAEASDYETATGAHIITETIKGTDIDHQSLLNAETQKLIHQMSLDMINIVFQTMPNILDGISAQLRQEADLRYKCGLQNDWIKYANKECDKFK
jgi:hypothetical protein